MVRRCSLPKSSDCINEQWLQGLRCFHVCGHLKHHPIIKVLCEPQTLPPFPLPLMWRYRHFTVRTLPLTFGLGQTLRRTICLWKRYVLMTSKGRETKAEAGSIRQTLPLVNLFHMYYIMAEGGAVYSGISHTVKAERTYRLAHSTSTETSGPLCSQLQ